MAAANSRSSLSPFSQLRSPYFLAPNVKIAATASIESHGRRSHLILSLSNFLASSILSTLSSGRARAFDTSSTVAPCSSTARHRSRDTTLWSSLAALWCQHAYTSGTPRFISPRTGTTRPSSIWASGSTVAAAQIQQCRPTRARPSTMAFPTTIEPKPISLS